MALSLVRDGLRLHYEVLGGGSRDVLLAHGMTGTGRADWGALIEALDGDYRFVLPDLRSHGASEHRDDALGYPQMLDDLRALVAAEALDRPDLIGFSMGSELLLDLELAHPGTARSMVLIGLSTGCPPERAALRPADGVVTWPAGLRRLHEQHHGPDHWRTIFGSIATAWTERPELPLSALAQLRSPVLVVLGEDEMAFKHRQCRELAEVAADVRLEVVPGGGHAIHVQQPAAVHRLVKEFLADVVRRPQLAR